MWQSVGMLALALILYGCSATPNQPTPQPSVAKRVGTVFLHLLGSNSSRHALQKRSGIVAQSQQNQSYGQTVYDEDECVGVVVNNECHGSILPKNAVPKRCYGEMLFGKCTGPMF